MPDISIEDAIFAELNGNLEKPDVDIEELSTPEPEPEAVLSSGPVEQLGDGKTRQMKPFEEVFGWKPTHVPNFLVPVFTGFEVSEVPDPYPT